MGWGWMGWGEGGEGGGWGGGGGGVKLMLGSKHFVVTALRTRGFANRPFAIMGHVIYSIVTP